MSKTRKLTASRNSAGLQIEKDVANLSRKEFDRRSRSSKSNS